MSRLTEKLPFHYGWLIAFCGFLTLFSCLGLARFAYGMLLPSMRAGLDLAYDQMGFISTGNFTGYTRRTVISDPFVGAGCPGGAACKEVAISVDEGGSTRAQATFVVVNH